MSQEKKVAIVTGASQGLGEGIVAAYRARGWRVVANSRSIKPSEDSDVHTVAGDIGDPGVAKRVVAETVEKFGRVDTLVNNAGIFIASPFTDYTEEQYRQKLRTNLDGFFFTTQAAIPEMLKLGAGHIVQITTTLVEYADARIPSVLASITKGGLSAATRSLAIEYAARGIRANAVAPGLIKTPLNPPAMHETLAPFQPMQHMGEIADVAQAIMYLEDAAFVTGETIHVDGGMIAGH